MDVQVDLRLAHMPTYAFYCSISDENLQRKVLQLLKDTNKQHLRRGTAPKNQENPVENFAGISLTFSKASKATVTTTKPAATFGYVAKLTGTNGVGGTNEVILNKDTTFYAVNNANSELHSVSNSLVEEAVSIKQGNVSLSDINANLVHDSAKRSNNIQAHTETSLQKERTKTYSFVNVGVLTDFMDRTYFEPYCAMQSNAHKYLIWPDTPTDLTDWKYTRKRKCPKLTIPDDKKNTKRVKYSLNCDSGKPDLIPSFANRSDDIEVVTLKDSCLASFTNRCCTDDRGIPNIVHYVWYFKKEMKFCMFLSMISIIRYVRPCLILFHGKYLPYGKYWDYVIRIYPNVLHVKRPRPLYIFGKKISFHEHSGDIMRMDALMELGGMYFDTDTIVLRDLDPLRKYNMTLCRQSSGYLMNGFIMAKKNATFLTLWMEGYRKDYRNDSYVFNSMWYNKALAKKRTDLIHVEEGTLCAPTILIPVHARINNTLKYDWSKLYGFHLYAKKIRFPWDVDWIKDFNTTIGSMVRHVVYGNKELCE